MIKDWTAPKTIGGALDACGFVGTSFMKGLSFREIFGFEPNAVQQAIWDASLLPEIYALESSMGTGKTEAALGAAYRLLSEGRATGVFFALPTRATANLMVLRVQEFLGKVVDHGHALAKLSHSTASLYQDFGSEGGPGGSWYDGTKNSLLAPIAVGTVDQALMAVINVRFSAVRSFALAGKVIIVDEVHSYDAYTGTLLSALVKFVRQHGGTVILLSATLTDSALHKVTGHTSSNACYPRLSIGDRDDYLTEPPAGKLVQLSYGRPLHAALDSALADAQAGAQVLVILNTVDEAVNAYRSIRRALPADRVGLLHSRYTGEDRKANETHWCSLFGKRGDRSIGRVLIGTQVLEQSLDLDADVMYTFLAPTDMLFQRAGRLHRHARPRPAGYEVPVLHVVTPEGLWDVLADEDADARQLKELLGGTGHIYDLHTLVRTHMVWSSRGGSTVDLPGDIRGMLEDTYR